MTIYKVCRGYAWDEYDIAYLTKDKLEEYLNEVYNSPKMERYKKDHYTGLDNMERNYQSQLNEAIENCELFLSPLSDVNAELASRRFNDNEHEAHRIQKKLLQIQKMKDEVISWGRDEWLHYAYYSWEPIRINDMTELERPDEDNESEDWD